MSSIHLMYSVHHHVARLRPRLALGSCSSSPSSRASMPSAALPPCSLKLLGSEILGRGRRNSIHFVPPIAAMDDGSCDFHSFFDDGYDSGGFNSGYESDTELVVNPSADVDVPTRREHLDNSDSMLTVTAHRFSTIQRGYTLNRIPGVMINMGLIAFLTVFLLFIDWCSWKIVRLPLEPFYLTCPFSISAVLSACIGCLYVPLVDSLKIHRRVRKNDPITLSSKRAIPTTGGLFFIPIGITIARGLAGQHSVEVYGAALATMTLAAIGLLDDILNCRSDQSNGLQGWIKFFLQVAVTVWFSFWLDSANISTPYSMKFFVPLPPPVGLVYLGKHYLIMTPFSFVAMVNGVKLTDGLDGLAGGAAAFAFIGMSVAVLAVCPGLAVFGASMAGACIGFLFHNKYKASVCMGDTGSLALGGALAAMAACTGMFLPLLISSGVFILEIISIVVQVLYMMVTRRRYPSARRILRMAPLHHRLLSYGLQEPAVVSITYLLSCILALFAGYVGLISS